MRMLDDLKPGDRVIAASTYGGFAEEMLVELDAYLAQLHRLRAMLAAVDAPRR